MRGAVLPMSTKSLLTVVQTLRTRHWSVGFIRELWQRAARAGVKLAVGAKQPL